MSEHEPSAGPKSSYEGDDTQAKSVAAEETAGARVRRWRVRLDYDDWEMIPYDGKDEPYVLACDYDALAADNERLTREVEELRGAVYSKIDPHDVIGMELKHKIDRLRAALEISNEMVLHLRNLLAAAKVST